MDRRRAAGLLLALAACIATATAAPTASNHTALDLYDGAAEGCYYNFQHYGEGDRIMTNEPCLNCTCHNRMLMCYLRVCPFTKPIGQDCTIEKRADQCCPIVTCPDVPVDLLTSTTTSPAEYGSTGMGKLDKFGCSINGKYFSEGSKVPPTPNKPCEHCYCIRNMTTCVMQECTLHVDGCTPIYHKDVCCPVRYSCDHPEDEMPLLDDMSTTVRPTPGFLLTTTTISPVTQMSQDCVYDNRIFPDGALIKTEKACDHCYCMKGDIVCVVQECGTPMENEGKNCTALPPREGVCCPDTYICEGDEASTATYEPENLTTLEVQEKLTTLSPPRRTSSEGSGYRNEPDDVPYTESPEITPGIEGSGEEEEHTPVSEDTTNKYPLTPIDEILAITEETQEYIPLTTTKPKDELELEATTADKNIFKEEIDRATETQQQLSSTTIQSTKDSEEPITDKNIMEDLGSGEIPADVNIVPQEDTSEMPITYTDNVATTESNKRYTSNLPGQDSIETSSPFTDDENTLAPPVKDVSSEDSVKPMLPTEPTISVVTDDNKISPELTESTQTDTKDTEHFTQTTLHTIISDETTNDVTETVDKIAPTNAPKELDEQHYSSRPSATIDDEFVTTESFNLVTDERKEPEQFEPQHVTASTPMLEEIEKDSTEYTKPEIILATSDTTPINIPIEKDDTKDLPELPSLEDVSATTNYPIFDKQEVTEKAAESPVYTTVIEGLEQNSSSSENNESERKSTTEASFTTYEYGKKEDESSTTTLPLASEKEKSTTEPDKGLNTIPSDAVEEQVTASPEVQKTTQEEDISTDPDNDSKFSSDREEVLSISTLEPQEELLHITTELAPRKDDQEEIDLKTSTEAVVVTQEVTSMLTHDHTESTESDTDKQRETDTTSEPKYTPNIDETLVDKTTLRESSFEITTSKISVEPITEKVTTNLPLYEKETTTINQEDNEIFNEPRIPGEGDCLLNGVTYSNDSAVPSSHKCQTGCKCVSSIIKCDPIICSPPTEYMQNMNSCETIYDTPDACCPTYICDHKTETIPPQSHSQMSGTEAPVISPVPCKDDACEISTDKTHAITPVPSEDCKSGSCTGPSDNSNELSNLPVEKPSSDKKDECVGDECKQVLCSEENGCHVSPVQQCEGEKCETVPDILPPKTQTCETGGNCNDYNVPINECTGGNCDTTSSDIQGAYPKKPCSEKEGCADVPLEEACKGDNCRRKDSSPLEHPIPEPCEGLDCKQDQTDTESSSTPSGISVYTEKQIATTDTLDQMAISKLPESHDIATKYPDSPTDEAISSVSDSVTPTTNPEVETTSKLSESTYSPEHITVDSTTEKNASELPETTETSDSDKNKYATLGTIDISTEKSEGAEILPDVTEPVQTNVAVAITEASEQPQPGEQTQVTEVTEPGVIITESHISTEPSHEIEQNKDVTDNNLEVNTDSPKLQDDIHKPDVMQQTADVESSTDSLVTTQSDITQSQEVTKVSEKTEFDENVTETPQTSLVPTITDTDKLTELTDASKGTTLISDYDTTTSSAKHDDLPNVTVASRDSEEVSTADSAESEKPTGGSESLENVQPEHISTTTMELATTEPSKTLVTEISDVSKYTESTKAETSEYNDTTDKSSTEPTAQFTKEQYETTISEDVEKTTIKLDENVTVLPQTQDESQLDDKHPDDTKHDVSETNNDIEDSSTPKSYDNHKTTTLLISEQSSSQPPKYDTEIQILTESPQETDTKDSSSYSPETSSDTPVTSHEVLDDDKITESDISMKPDDKPVELHPIDQNEAENIPVDKDQVNVALEHHTTETSKYSDKETDIPELVTETSQENTTPKIQPVTEEPTPFITETHDMPKLSEESTTYINEPESSTELPETDQETISELSPITEEPILETDIPEMITNTQDSDHIEQTTRLPSEDSKISTLQEDFKQTTESSLSSDSKPMEPSSDKITTSDIQDVTSTEASDVDQTKYDTQNPDNVEEVTSISSDKEHISKPETTEEPVKTSEHDVSQQIDTKTQEPTELDELRTTPVSFDVTTLKTSEITQSVQDIDMKTDRPEINTTYQQETTEKLGTGSLEVSTEELLANTETVIPSSTSTERSVPLVTSPVEDSGTDVSQITTEEKTTTQKSYTEEPINKYSSPEPSDNTVEPTYEHSIEPHKPEEDSIQSLVTDKYDEHTKPSDYETFTNLPTSPVDEASVIVKEEFSTTPGSLIDSTHKEVDENIVPIPEKEKPGDEEIRTESQSTDEFTTQKMVQTEDNAVSQESSTTEPIELTSGTTLIHKITEPSDIPNIVESTDKTLSDATLTESAGQTSKPSFDSDESKTETPFITEISDKTQTASVPEITSPYDQTQTEKSEIMSETPEFSEAPTLKPVSQKQDEDENLAGPSEKDSDLTTLKPISETEIVSLSESTIAPKQDSSTSISEDAGITEKNKEDGSVTTSAEQQTTESIPSAIYTEKQSEGIPTAFTEKATSDEEYATTIRQTHPEIHETTVTSLSDYNDITTHSTLLSESQDKEPQLQEEEQPIPVVIAETEKTQTLEESVATQTERIVPASEKPMQTEGPEEEFITATSKSTSVDSEDLTTVSAAADKTTLPAVTTLAPTATILHETVAISDAKVTSSPDITELPAISEADTPTTKTPEIEEYEQSQTTVFEESVTKAPEQSSTTLLKDSELISKEPISTPDLPTTAAPDKLIPEEAHTMVPEAPITIIPELSNTAASDAPVTSESLDDSTTIKESLPTAPEIVFPETQATDAPEQSVHTEPEESSTGAPEVVASAVPDVPISYAPELPATAEPEVPITNAAELPEPTEPEVPVGSEEPDLPKPTSAEAPELPVSTEEPRLTTPVSSDTPEALKPLSTEVPEVPEPISTEVPEVSVPVSTEMPDVQKPVSTEVPEVPEPVSTEMPDVQKPVSTEVPEVPEPVSTEMPEVPKPVLVEVPEVPKPVSTEVPKPVSTEVPDVPKPVSTEAPEVPKPVSTEAVPTDDTLTPDEESFPPSGGTSGYGQEPDYVDEDQTFGPGTCRYGGKVYVSAQQIPRDDPCDFCFCFRSDIICLQQSCPPPIHGCHEEPIQGFCCPRYECPVSMATTVNVTTTTTTTTTTLPPHFPTHSYRGSAQKRGCQIKGQTYKVGEVVRASSGPCLHCTCGGDGQMKCDPKVCTPEPMLRQMIAAAVSAKRRR